MRGRWNRKEYMKVTKEYEVADAAKNPQTGEVLFALKATGNCCIYTDDGEHLDSTDEAHLQANIREYMKLELTSREKVLEEHYKKLHDYYEKS